MTTPTANAGSSRLCNKSAILAIMHSSGAKILLVRVCAVLLLAVHVSLLAWAATRDSPTLNEPGHLIAGIANWRFGRYDIYCVNPPLTRMIAALPVLAAGAEIDFSQFSALPGVRSEFLIGGDFIEANGARSLYLFMIARWACIPISVLGGIVCFLWGRSLYGDAAGLLSLSLWCFDPNVLAHGHLITPDIAASVFGLTACYLFWLWLKQPTWWRALAAGVGLGLAELSKMSWLFLFGLWPLIWLFTEIMSAVAARIGKRSNPPNLPIKHKAIQIVIISILGLYILNLGYSFDGTGTSLRSFVFVSRCLAGQEQAGHGGNIFSASWMGHLPVPVPKPYLIGLDLQKRDFEHFEHPSYLRGEWKDGGWWHYYLYGMLVKVPHGTQLLFALAILLTIKPRALIILECNEIILLTPALLLLILVSAERGFNHHVRYILPIFGFLFVFTGRLMKRPRHGPLIGVVISLLILATTISSIRVSPNFLPYFNEGSGGPTEGHRHLLHSNIDWGQDLIALKETIENHPQFQGMYFVTSNYWDPAAIGIDCQKLPIGCNPNTSPDWWKVLSSRFLAINTNELMGNPCRIYLGPFNYIEIKDTTFAQLRGLQPVAKAGASIWIFDLARIPISDRPPSTNNHKS